MYYFKIFILIWNVIIFTLYGIDKHKAVKRRHRIKETTLIVPAFLLGSIGAMMGMIVFNHKTSKTKFRILIPLAFILNIACLIILKGR